MRNFYFASTNALSLTFRLIAAFMLLFETLAWSQTVNPEVVPAPIPSPLLQRNLPRQTTNPEVVGSQPLAAMPGAAGPMNYVRTYTPRIAITSEDRVFKGSVDSVQVSPPI